MMCFFLGWICSLDVAINFIGTVIEDFQIFSGGKLTLLDRNAIINMELKLPSECFFERIGE